MFVTIGRIKGTRGLQGEVKVSPESDHPDRLDTLPRMTVFIQKGNMRQPYQVVKAAWQQADWLLKLSGVDTREQAAALVGGELQISKHQVLPLPEGSYYIFELIGLDVYTVSGERLGAVVDVLQPGANDVYVVQSPEQQELLVPAIKQVVKSINLNERRMVIEPLPGLFDLADEDEPDAD
ncbi:MAG: ribosome maturation factor RimM [Bacillota bacterium]|jgi:16S rRNA processing protein RimM